jgi:hypothetical protein
MHKNYIPAKIAALSITEINFTGILIDSYR